VCAFVCVCVFICVCMLGRCKCVCVYGVTQNSFSHGVSMAQICERVRKRESACVCVL